MASRSSSTQRTQRREHAASASQPIPPSMPSMPSMDVGATTRQQLAMISEAVAQMLRSSANLQMAQQDFAQRAARLCEDAAEGLRHAHNYNEVVRIQSHLMTSCARAAMECGQDLMLTGVKLGSAPAEPAATPEPEPSSPSSAAEAAMSAMAPAMQAWQQFLAMAANNSGTPHH